MAKLKVGFSNINAWTAKTEAAKRRVERSASDHVRAKAKEVLKAALKASPQWSGNYALNWRLETSSSGPSSYSSAKKVNPWQHLPRSSIRSAGHKDAIEHGLWANREVLENLKYNNIIKLVNSSPVADAIEQDKVALRPVNRVVIGHMGVLGYLKTKYKFVR